jgi:hypothetical protein
MEILKMSYIYRKVISSRTQTKTYLISCAIVFAIILPCSSKADNCTNSPVSGQYYSIVNHGSGMALDISNNLNENGRKVTQNSYVGSSNQQFYFTNLNNGYWVIQGSESKKALSVNWLSDEDGDNIQQQYYYGGHNQQWQLEQTRNGDFRILTRRSNKPMTVGGDNNDADVYQKTDTLSTYQRWYLNPIDGNCNSQIENERNCDTLAPTDNYGAEGPFHNVEIIKRIGPKHNYTLFRPALEMLGKDGFKHPIATWGNGILTTPNQYKTLLTLIASHGFVVIACNDIQAERSCLNAGLDWLIEQNESGQMAGKLDITREVSIGYSWGGGAAIDVANRPNMKATVSLHGMPPRESKAFDEIHNPLLLFTSTGDKFVYKEKYVTPNYDKSNVQTFYATLNDPSVGHLYVIDKGSLSCLVSPILGACGDAQQEQAPTIAWLRMFACNDQYAREYFYGEDCRMCLQPWSAKKKHWPTPDNP